MSYLLDSSICIKHLRNQYQGLADKNRNLKPGEEILLCTIVHAELWAGFEKSLKLPQTEENLKKFVADFPCKLFDEESAKIYGAIRAFLEKAGMKIGGNDLMIAAIALQHQRILVTNNLAEFQRVPGLLCEAWT